MFRRFRRKRNRPGRAARLSRTRQTCQRRYRPASRASQRGVTITEALIATLIFSLSAGAVFSVFANGALQRQMVRDRAVARVHLESLLSEIDASCRFGAGLSEGAIDERYAFRVSVAPYADKPVRASRIAAAIDWRTRGIARSLELTTIHLGACGATDAG